MNVAGILVFRTNSATIRAEKLLRGAAMEAKAIPDPRRSAAACGLAVRFPWALRDRAQQLVREIGLELVAVCRLESSMGEPDGAAVAEPSSVPS